MLPLSLVKKKKPLKQEIILFKIPKYDKSNFIIDKIGHQIGINIPFSSPCYHEH